MEWMPIKTAPKDGSDILTWSQNGNCSVRFWGGNESGYRVWLPRIRDSSPSHWMPLPEPPEVER